MRNFSPPFRSAFFTKRSTSSNSSFRKDTRLPRQTLRWWRVGKCGKKAAAECFTCNCAKKQPKPWCSASRRSARPGQVDAWRAPRLEPLDVVGGVAVLGLLVEDPLKAESLAAEGLIPIDTSVLSPTLPRGVSDGPTVRPVAAWYAPHSDFTLTAQYVQPPAEMAVTTSLLLILADKGQEVFGGLSFLPRVEKRFAFDLPSRRDGRSTVSRRPMASRFVSNVIRRLERRRPLPPSESALPCPPECRSARSSK